MGCMCSRCGEAAFICMGQVYLQQLAWYTGTAASRRRCCAYIASAERGQRFPTAENHLSCNEHARTMPTKALVRRPMKH